MAARSSRRAPRAGGSPWAELLARALMAALEAWLDHRRQQRRSERDSRERR